MCKNAESWVFTLPADFHWQSGIPLDDDYAFVDRTQKLRLVLKKSGMITVTEGYAWDGCSPKFCMVDILFGTPDGVIDSTTHLPKTYHASLVHDALYQFLRKGLPFNRAQADNIFLRLMWERGFAPRSLYWLAVRLIGWLFVLQHRYVRKNIGQRLPTAPQPG